MVFDAAIQRWQALQFTYGDHFKPTLGNFAKFSLALVFPSIAFYQMIWGPAHVEYKRQIARGEIPYDHPARKQGWFAQ